MNSASIPGLRSAFWLIVLAFPINAQETSAPAKTVVSVATFKGVPITAESPSVVPEPKRDSPHHQGEGKLANAPSGVVDGDTLRIDGAKQSLRLIGLDAEETFKDEAKRRLASLDWAEYVRTENAGHLPNRPPKYGTPLGEAAKAFAADFFADVTHVVMESDDASRIEDGYGRKLVHVFAMKGEYWINFNVEVVRQGLSPYFVKYGRSQRFDAAFESATKEAREAKRGIFGEPPPFRCYPDYATRLSWWSERERDLVKIQERRAKGEDIILLGERGAFQKLIDAAGKNVTVAASADKFRERGKLGFWPLPHAKGEEFVIVGEAAKAKALGLEKEDGNILLFVGTISLYNGKPQFQLDDVKFSRVN